MKQCIKLLLLIPHLGGGGAERVAAMLASRLDRNRFNIHLALIQPDQPGSEPPPSSITLHYLHSRRVRHAWLKLIRLIRAEKPQIVLSGMAHLNFLVLLLKPLLPTQTRILIRQNSTASASMRNALDRILYKHLYPSAHAILCQSQAMADDLLKNFQIPSEKLAVLPNPIDIETIRRSAQAPVSPVTPRLIAVARLSHEKGLDLLLEAMAILKQPHPAITLNILGAGPEEANLRRQCTHLNLDPQVEFLGFTPNPIPHLANASLFVLPSRHEGMPNALLEAAAVGLPIVATPCCHGVIDLLLNQPGTWLTPAITAEAIAATIATAIGQLANGPARFHHTFLAPFEITTAIAAYESVILQTAAGHP